MNRVPYLGDPYTYRLSETDRPEYLTRRSTAPSAMTTGHERH